MGALGPACPARDLTVEITTTGTNSLITACETSPNTCKADCSLEVCDQSTCLLRNVCRVGDNPPWTVGQTMGVRVLLLQATPDGINIENQTPPGCLPLNLRPCFDPACNAGGSDAESCVANRVATVVEGALVTGLSFPGFTNTDGVSLAVAFFHKPGDGGAGEQTCDEGLVNPTDCDIGNLTAVAGLANLSGSDTFDITCASCQNGSHDSAGPDNAACPETQSGGTNDAGVCFLERVAAALVDAGLTDGPF